MSAAAEENHSSMTIRRLEKVVARLKILTQKYRQAEVIQQALFRISELAALPRKTWTKSIPRSIALLVS